MEELRKIVNTVEFTDELIHLNKEFQKVDEICDILTTLIEKIEDIDHGIELTYMNAEIKTFLKKNPILNLYDAQEILVKMEEKAFNLHRMISLKANEILTFQKLGNAISIYKQI